ncbi:MAG: glycosyltransferase, partial [Methanophagales archaeon]|nr:glycosyltransferase [Methanophagales archaeon]
MSSTRQNMPRILFTTPVLEHPAAGGPQLRIENTIKALSQISDLYIYSRVSLDALGGANGLSFYEQYCKRFYFAPSMDQVAQNNRYVGFAKIAINFLSRRTIKRNILTTDQEVDSLDLLNVAGDINADVIWLGYGNISYPFLKYLKSHSEYKVVLDTDSVWSRFVIRSLPFANDRKERQQIEKKGREKEEEERWGTQLADVTTAVSEVDADYYRGIAKHPQQIHLFSNVIDVETYQQTPPPVDDLKKPCLYLAGTFWPQSPMEDAARWVIAEVLPLVRQQIPNIHFYIIGNGSDQILSDIKDPNITITGKLPSVLPHLCHADVALVPLKFESGTRFKILEAGACKIPIVSTTLGAEGLSVEHEKHILIADTPESFANAIINLLTNPELCEKLSESCYELIEERYS